MAWDSIGRTPLITLSCSVFVTDFVFEISTRLILLGILSGESTYEGVDPLYSLSLVIAAVSAVSFATCPSPSTSTPYFNYPCICFGDIYYEDINVCRGQGTGCDPLYQNKICAGNCFVESAGSCTFGHSAVKPKEGLLTAAAISLPSKKPKQCPAKKIFESWLAQKLGSRYNSAASGLQ